MFEAVAPPVMKLRGHPLIAGNIDGSRGLQSTVAVVCGTVTKHRYPMRWCRAPTRGLKSGCITTPLRE
jgi:hypothetical protein